MADEADRQCLGCAQRGLEVGEPQVERDAEHHQRQHHAQAELRLRVEVQSNLIRTE